MQPPSAATVVQVSHGQYQSHVQSKRKEVIEFRNQLMHAYTNPLKKRRMQSKKPSMEHGFKAELADTK